MRAKLQHEARECERPGRKGSKREDARFAGGAGPSSQLHLSVPHPRQAPAPPSGEGLKLASDDATFSSISMIAVNSEPLSGPVAGVD